MITKKFYLKLLVFSFCFIAQAVLSFNPLCAASKKKQSGTSSEVIVDETKNSTGQEITDSAESKTKITKNTKDRKASTYFSKIEKAIVDGVENGSPSSIKLAMSQIRKSELEYTEAERVLIIIGTEIMKTVWPSEKVTWDVPEFTGKSVYTSAFEFVNEGFFDSSTGNKDFLSAIIPAMIIFDKDISEQNILQCENALGVASAMVESSVLLDYMKGILNEKKKNYEEAEKYFSKLYALDSSVYEIKYHLATVQLALGKGDAATNVASSLVFSGNEIEALKLNAKIAYDQKQLDKAEEYVARVLQQTPNDLEFLLFRAKIMIEKKDYIHAVSLLDMYARQNSTNLDYLLLRAKVQLDWSKNTTLATETIEKALSLYPESTDVLLLAARVASTTDSPVAGKYADELVAKILESDPENEEALLYALDGLISRSAWQSAYDISRKLAANENPSPELISKHIDICLKLGKKTEAVTVSTAAYNKNPGDETILLAYILAQSSAGNKGQSMTLINSLLDSSSSKVKSYLYYRRSYLQSTESAQLADLRSSLIANPRNSDSLFRLYEIYFDKQDYRKAQYYLKQVVALKPNDSSIKKLNESLTQLLQ